MPRSSDRRQSHRSAVITLAVFGLLLTASKVPAATTSIKAIMSEMAGTTKLARTAAASGDLAKAQAVLMSFAAESRSAAALVGGGDPRSMDLRKRFTVLASTAEGAQPARFKAAFGAIVSQCRSCHDVYR